MKLNITKALRRVFALGTVSVMAFSIQVSAATVQPIRWSYINVSSYTSTQGMCMDNKNNVYVAKVNNSNLQVNIYKITPNGTMSKVVHRANALGHANDMTYCSANGYIYVATGGDDSNTSQSYDIIAFNPAKKGSDGYYEVVGRYTVPDISGYASGIAYDAKYKVFYIKKGNKVYVGNFKNGTFNSSCKIELKYGVHEGYTNQGITAHQGKIYIPLWDKSGAKNSVIRVYDVTKNSNTSYSVKYNSVARYDDNSKKNDKFEIEGVDFSTSGKMFFATNGETTKGASDDAIFKLK